MNLIKIIYDSFKYKTINTLFKCRYNNLEYSFLKKLPKEEYPFYLKKIYKSKMKCNLNLKNPKRLTEKIQWLKLYDNLEEKTYYTDKISVRDYFIKKLISEGIQDGAKYLKKVLGIYNCFDEIDFQKLPNSFFMQTNHGAKMLLKVKNKEIFLQNAYEITRKRFNDWLDYNFAFCAGFELQYKNIQPKIIIEKLYRNTDNSPIVDYMVYCFNGEPQICESLCFASTYQKNKIAFYDLNWNVIPVYQIKELKISPVAQPSNLKKMIELARILSKDFKFVRVDFIEVDNQLYFLELTFTPNSGLVRFIPDKYDFIFGDYLKL